MATVILFFWRVLPYHVNFATTHNTQNMRKFLLLFIAALSISGTINAEKKELKLTYHRQIKSGTKGNIDRAPMRLPIDVYFDSEAGIIEVAGDDTLEADVTLCDETGAALDYSPVINATFSVEGLNPAYVLIEGENWYATADLDLNFN